MILMKDWHVYVPEYDRRIGFDGENRTRRLEIHAADAEEGWAYRLDARYGNGRQDFLLLELENGVLWTELDREMLSPGILKAQVRAAKGDLELRSNLFELDIRPSLRSADAFAGGCPSAFRQLEERLEALKQDGEIAAVTAENAAGRAETAAANAGQSAEAARQSAATAESAAGRSESAAGRAENAARQAGASAEQTAADAERAKTQAERAEALTAKMPVVRGGNWWTYDAEAGAYRDSGQPARGEKGETGNVLFASFTADPESGLLTMHTPDAYQGPEFRLNEGFLEVLVNG